MENQLEVSKQIDSAVIRSFFGALPFVGQALNETFFDVRWRLKQDRFNKFTEMFAEYFIGKPEFDLEAFKTEDFGDLFEAIMMRVVQTKSENKHKRYRDVLIKQFENTLPNADNSGRYLELISVLDEVEISIIYNHRVFDENFKLNEERLRSMKADETNLKSQYKENVQLSAAGHANDKTKIQNDLDGLRLSISNLQMDLSKFEIYREASCYRISESQFMFYKQNLYSKALLNDSAAGGDSYGYFPFKSMGITEFGKEFLAFLISE